MIIDDKEFSLLEELAGVRVAEDDRIKLIEDLGSVLGYVKKLQELDLGDLDYDREVVSVDDLRKDEIVAVSGEERDRILDNFCVRDDSDLLEAHAVLDHKK